MESPPFAQEDWVHLGQWIQGALPGAFWTRWFESGSAGRILGATCSPLLFLDGHTLTTKEDYATLEAIAKNIVTTKNGKDLLARLEAEGIRAQERHTALLAPGAEVSVQEILDSYLDVVGVWTTALLLSRVLEEQVFAYGIVDNEGELFEKVAPYVRTTWLEAQPKDIARIAAALGAKGISFRSADEVLAHKEASEYIDAHVGTYAWFGTHHWEGSAYTHERCAADVYAAMQKEQKPEEKMRAPDTSDPYASVWELLAAGMYWRTHCAEVTSKVIFTLRPVLAGQAKQWGLSYEEFLFLTGAEVVQKIHVPETALPENFRARFSSYGVVRTGGVETVLVGDAFSTAIAQVVPKIVHEGNEIKGTVASKGAAVHAPAKVIMGPREFDTFNDGDVLVTNETTPDFVPLMKRASAIVTDIGGITSHAAIVSRELGIPCVTATKVATQVLQNDMRVTVDTTKGVITF